MSLRVASTANSTADYWASLGDRYSLHTGNPTAAGTANEATGGGYARQTTTWGSASGGIVTGSQMTFSVVTATYTHACRWSSGGTLRDIIDITDASISPDGQIKMTPSNDANYVVWT